MEMSFQSILDLFEVFGTLFSCLRFLLSEISRSMEISVIVIGTEDVSRVHFYLSGINFL